MTAARSEASVLGRGSARAPEVIFALKSPSFHEGGAIPIRYSKSGANVSPPLTWDDPPPGTQSYVLILEDVDAPLDRPRRHWIVYDIPSGRHQLSEGRSPGGRTGDLSHAENDFGHLHYDGPSAEEGDRPHTYRFRLVALGVKTLGVPPQPKGAQIWDRMRDYILAEAELSARFHQDAARF
mgnify:CR=1 FL=1